MKKFGLGFVLFIFAVFVSYSETTGDLSITGTVAQQLSVSLGSDVTGYSINTNGDIIGLGNATVRSNMRPWTIAFTALHGALTLYEGETPTAVTTEQIAYTFDFNRESTEDSEKITVATLTSTEADNDIQFQRKTEGGSGGEDFPIRIVYVSEASQPSNKNWVAGTYKDTIYVKVTAP